MSVEKRGTGYTVRWRDHAGQQRSQQVTLWRDAVALDGEMKRKKAMGELITHEKGTIKLCDFWDVYVAQHAIPNLSLRTRGGYSTLYSKHISKAIGSLPLKTISLEHVANLSAQLSRTLAPSSVRGVLAVLSSVLQRAVEWGYIATNPATRIRKPKLVQREGRALTHDEIAALLAELPDGRSRVIVGTLVETGIRPGELRALRWKDHRDGKLVIHRAASSNQIGPTKTNSLRSVPTGNRLDDVLKRWRFAHNLDPADVLMFPGKNGKLWTDQGWRMWQRQVFASAAARAGLKGVRPYDLRHTYASRWIASGLDVFKLAKRLGHSPTMTLTVYGHLFDDESVRAECASEVDTA